MEDTRICARKARVGRAARLGNDGEAVLFLGPKELEFEDTLKEDIEDLTFSKAKLGAVLDVLAQTTMRKYCGNNKNPSSRNNPTEHIAVKALLSAAERKMQSDPSLKSRAEDAFRSHVRAVAAYPSALKHIFHVKRLHLGHVAGLARAPEVPLAGREHEPQAFLPLLGFVRSQHGARHEELSRVFAVPWVASSLPSAPTSAFDVFAMCSPRLSTC